MSSGLSETMSDEKLGKELILSVVAIVIWSISAWGAFSLLQGLANGPVVQGADSAVNVDTMWMSVIGVAALGIVLGIASFYRKLPTSILFLNTVLAFLSLTFSVLAG